MMQLRKPALSFLATLIVASPTLAGTIFVNDSANGAQDGGSWDAAFRYLQDALIAAAPGDELWVASGIYSPDKGAGKVWGSQSASFVLDKDLSLFGGFAGDEATLLERAGLFEQTFLSGDLLGDDGPGFMNTADNSFHVVRSQNATIELDGFVVTGGVATAGGAWPEHDGGGVLGASGSMSIRNCVFRANMAAYGGGVYSGGSISIMDSAFLFNQGGGFHAATNGTAEITDCSFSENTGGNGAGVFSSAATTLLVSRTEFLENSGYSGAGLNSGGTTTVVDCSFVGNTSTSRGGGVYLGIGSFVDLINCAFSGNATMSDYGGGLASEAALVELKGCTFTRNSSLNNQGSGITLESGAGALSLDNCVLWGNGPNSAQDNQVWNKYSSVTLSVNYSCIQGLSGSLGGIANIGLDPLFVDADGPDNIVGTEDDDLRLQLPSPCIDSGSNSAFPVGITTDLQGLPRFQDELTVVDAGLGTAPVVDRGAYEFEAEFFFQTYGSGCAGSGGVTPQFSISLMPSDPSSLTVSIQDGVGGGSALIFIGLNQGSLPMGFGCALYVSPLLPSVVGPIPLFPFGSTGPGAGSITFPASIPDNASPGTITLQAVVIDAGVPGGFSNTNGVALVIP